MSRISFFKMQGIGNDYVYIDCLEKALDNPESLAPKLADRNFGIGGDGIVLIEPSTQEDFKMRMFNADGSQAEMCGNAVRCVAKYLYDKGITKEKNISLETLGGTKHLELKVEGATTQSVRVDMGKPALRPSEIPVNSQAEQIVNQEYEIDGEKFSMTCVSMGNPHAVFFVDKITDHQVLKLGPKIEIDPIFPNKINAHFVQIISQTEINMRVWERGTGETLACGTGACAVLVAAVLTDKTERKASVTLPGGTLEIEWAEDDHVYMTGPAEFVFEGEIEI